MAARDGFATERLFATFRGPDSLNSSPERRPRRRPTTPSLSPETTANADAVLSRMLSDKSMKKSASQLNITPEQLRRQPKSAFEQEKGERKELVELRAQMHEKQRHALARQLEQHHKSVQEMEKQLKSVEKQTLARRGAAMASSTGSLGSTMTDKGAADGCLADRYQGLKTLLPRYRSKLAMEAAVFGADAATGVLSISPPQKALYQHHYGTPDARFVSLPPE